MEWDFTTSQLHEGKIDYKLENFLQDFQAEIEINFPKCSKKQKEKICNLFYGVMYFEFTGHSHNEISKIFKFDIKFVEIIIQQNKANIEMLGAVIMNIFLINLRETDGLLSDKENLRLVNAQLKYFHKLHKL